MCKFQNVPWALGFEVKYSKFFYIAFWTYNNFKYGFHFYRKILIFFFKT